MKKKSKKYRAVSVDKNKIYEVETALEQIVQKSTAKFDESIDVAVHLSVDTQQANQQVKGVVELPHGLGKNVRVVVFAKGEQEKQAESAKADYVGSEDLIQKIKDGWLEFDRVIATPDQMPVVSKVAPILGPRGLMPNPKMGTVTPDVGKAVTQEKKGKAVFKAVKSGKNGLVHSPIGKRSLGVQKLKENYQTFMQSLVKAKPVSSKGNYLRSISLSATMGPGFNLDVNEVMARN